MQKVASPLPLYSPLILKIQLFIYLCEKMSLAKQLMISSIFVDGWIAMKGNTDIFAD
jgi:hypothetical protein